MRHTPAEGSSAAYSEKLAIIMASRPGMPSSNNWTRSASGAQGTESYVHSTNRPVSPRATVQRTQQPVECLIRGGGHGRGTLRTPRWPVAVVFDFDGLLMDTETSLLDSWRYEWAQWGLKLDEATFFADHGGDTSEEKYRQLAAAVGSTYDRVLSHERRLAFRAELHATLDLSRGLREWIAEAVSLGMTVGVASSSSRGWVEGHLNRVGVRERFAVLACGDEVQAAKPAPDVYHLALDRMGVKGSDAVAVEDTVHGVAAAHAAGLRAIAIPNSFVEASRLGMAELVLESAEGVSLTDALRVVGPFPGGGRRGGL